MCFALRFNLLLRDVKSSCRGEKIEDITKQMTVEGVPTAKVAVEFARRCGLDLPIFNAVNLIISGELKIEVNAFAFSLIFTVSFWSDVH